MNINAKNLINFGARSPEIRKADDIRRKAAAEFPMLSSSYIDTFYKTTGKQGRITKKRISLYDAVCKKISKVRDTSNTIITKSSSLPYIKKLEAVKQEKAGNCMESAMAAVTALLANDYVNTTRGSLVLSADLINKKTGEIVYSGVTSLDHSFALTDMDKGKKNIVVDNWLGFADSKEGAIARYKKIKTERDIEKAVERVANQYYSYSYDIPYDEIKYDFDVKSRMMIQECNELSAQNKEFLSEYAKKNFPNLVIK